MVGAVEAQLTPGNSPATLRDAFYAGFSLQQMAPLVGCDITAGIAERYELHTSTEAQNPGSFWEFRRAQKLERALDGIADTVEARFREEPAFADSFKDGTFPLKLAATFDFIERIDAEGVGLKNERLVDGRTDGDVFIEETVFTVAPGSTQLLNTVFNTLLHKNISKDKKHREGVHRPLVYADEGEGDIPPTITIRNVSEHDIRAMGRAVDAVVWRSFRKQGIRTPAEKMSLNNWEAWGYTFPYDSQVLAFMETVIGKYCDTPVTAIYDEKYANDRLKPTQRKLPLGTDSSGIFRRWRDIVNGLGHHLRGGTSAYNLEQNQNRYDRLSLDEVELRRKSITEAQAAYGPGGTRLLTSAEAAAEALKQTIDEAKKDKFGTAIKATRTALGFSMIDLGLATVARLPQGVLFTGELSKDAAEYRVQQRAYKLGRVALRNVVWSEVMGARLLG